MTAASLGMALAAAAVLATLRPGPALALAAADAAPRGAPHPVLAGDPAARSARLEARAAEPRRGAGRARTVVVEEARGEQGDAAARVALRSSIAKHLRAQGLDVVEPGHAASHRLQPAVVAIDVARGAGGTDVEVRASVVAFDRKGRVAAIVEGGARARNVAPGAAAESLTAQALDAAARSIATDLARRLREAR